MIRLCVALAFLTALIVSVHAQWDTGSIVGVRPPNGSGASTAIFINTVYPQYSPTPNVWIDTDVTQFGVPVDAVGVYLGGILIITNGSETGTANLTIAFRTPGNTNTTCGSYIGQTISPNPPAGNGSRSTMGTWVPVRGGKIEWCWARGIEVSEYPAGVLPAWPAGPSYGINLTLQAYVEP